MAEKVSVIVPVYNLENEVSRCIASIQAQTYENWECICVNDGSTDSSGMILDLFAGNDERIKVIHQQNAGVCAARNAGLLVATGKYITFVDGDDMVSSDMLAKMMYATAQGNPDVVASGYWNCDADGTKRDMHHATKTFFFAQKRQDLTSLHVEQSLPFAWGKLYKSDIIKKKSLWFDEKSFFGEDTIFDFEYMMHAQSVSYVHEGLYMYCHRDGSCTSLVSRGKMVFSRYLVITQSFMRLYDCLSLITPSLPQFQCYALILLRIAGACKVAWLAARHRSLLFKGKITILLIYTFMKAMWKSPLRLWLDIIKESFRLQAMRRNATPVKC